MTDPWWRDLPRDSFGDTPDLTDELLALVLSGTKTATCMSLDSLAAGAFSPQAGERCVIVDSASRPACIIETLSSRDIRFCDVPEELAALEGEGDRTLASWRAGHETFFRREGTFRPDMMLRFEIFRLIERLD